MNQLKRLVVILVAILSAAALLSGCGDDDSDIGTPVEEYTKYLVQQAIDRYDAEGREAAFAYYQSPESVNGSWYVFILEDDLSVVNANQPDIVGTSTAERIDVNGKPYGKELVAATEDGVWVDYFFAHPVTGEAAEKHTWAVRHDSLVFASGWYQ
ncbi:MAG: cache domain-containing protein [Acidimicrobiaceae bacterium]|nr:cache domain-containing protein [Acidimicrobiaceae bacterium]MDE0606758.1 cache domain-containing protein [Acidimicrobiaceae bacterium]